MQKVIYTPNAPAQLGSYSQAIETNGLLFISGQIAINPETGDLIIDNIEVETMRVMENLNAILTEAGMSFTNAIKCSVFIRDMEMYSRINEVYASYFEAGTVPARELVEVSRLPKDVNIEISLIAAKN